MKSKLTIGFLTMSKSTSKTTEKSPANNKTIRITRPKELFLFFWVDEIEPDVDTTWNPLKTLTARDFFKSAARTRLVNLQSEPWYDARLHYAHCPPIQYFSEIQVIIDSYINKYGGAGKIEVKEISFFSHAGWDGPIIYYAQKKDPLDILFGQWKSQLKLPVWGTFNFYWAVNKECRLNFFGCNTGNEEKYDGIRIFSKNTAIILNNSNVIVSGQMTSSFPSFYPDSRFTSPTRSMNKGWDVGHTYMVSADGGKGKDAHYSRVEANKMVFYKGDKELSKSYQSIFNDHRNKTNNTNFNLIM